MPTVRLLPLMLLVVTHAVAQDHIPNRIPGEMSEETHAIAGNGFTLATPTPLPDAPTPHRVIDKKFVAVMGALGSAESLRFTTRKLVLDHEFAAGAPWVTRVPANQHLVAKYGGLYAAELLVTYELKKPHSWLPGDKAIRRFWAAYSTTMVAIHIKNGVGNIRTQGPGGCTSVACAEQMQ